MSELIQDVAEKGKTLISEGIQSAKEIIEDNAAVLREKAAEWGVDDLADDVKTYVRRNPWRAVSIAAAVGLVAGLFLKSKKDRAA